MRATSKAPIHSVKHYVQTTLSSVTAGALGTINVAVAAAPADVNSVSECIEGSVVKAIYCEYWLQQATASLGSFTFAVIKCPDSVVPVTGDLAALGTYTNKKNVLFTSQGISPANDSNAPLNVIRGWIKIPKGKQRLAYGDILRVCLRNNNGADDINYCGFTTYKEYQ